jgi:hypothetical protein
VAVGKKASRRTRRGVVVAAEKAENVKEGKDERDDCFTNPFDLAGFNSCVVVATTVFFFRIKLREEGGAVRTI